MKSISTIYKGSNTTRAKCNVVGIIFLLFLLICFVSLYIVTTHPCSDARTGTTEEYMYGIIDGLKGFKRDTGRYPTTLEGLYALGHDPGVPGWRGPYVELRQYENKIIPDQWGHAFQYESPAKHDAYRLYSFGADGKVGGWCKNADIKHSERRP